MAEDYQASYRARRVLVTGGLGFIGSTLARKLVQLGADVDILDALIPDYGGNRFNISGIEEQVRVTIGDIRDGGVMEPLLRDRDVIFNLAGQVSHIDSMRDPITDLDINCRAQLAMLETCRNVNPSARIVFAGTRQIYGKPERLPVDERHPIRPVDVNGINKTAGEAYHLLYANVFGLRACSLRLTNVYGPRQLIRHNRQGFIAWFVRLAVEDREIQVFGDGSQIRDFVYVDDAADAFLRAGASDAMTGGAFNVGGFEPIAHRDLVKLLIDAAGSGRVAFVPWPPEKRQIDIGSFYTDSSRIAAACGWKASVPLGEGLRRTVEYYRAHLAEYVNGS
jgi:UDP-glucose 4-epimerase